MKRVTCWTIENTSRRMASRNPSLKRGQLMNPVLADMAAALVKLAALYLPRAYQLGRAKARKKYGAAVPPWTEADNANVELLLSRHAEELSGAMARIELAAATGGPGIEEGLVTMLNRSGSWSWILSPALASGIAAGVDSARTEIARAEGLPAEDIGILWLTAEDARVCKKCLFLNGRWFDARHAYEIAATIHPNCRCPAHFDVGTPDEALVGPIPGYKPGTADMVYRDLGADPIIQARERRARTSRDLKPSQAARPNIPI